MAKPERHVFVCMNSRPPGHPKPSCGTAGAGDVLNCFQEEFGRRDLFGKVLLSGTTCLGPCDRGPTAVVYPEGVWYGNLTSDDVSEIVENHIVNGEPVERLLIPDEVWDWNS